MVIIQKSNFLLSYADSCMTLMLVKMVDIKIQSITALKRISYVVTFKLHLVVLMATVLATSGMAIDVSVNQAGADQHAIRVCYPLLS